MSSNRESASGRPPEILGVSHTARPTTLNFRSERNQPVGHHDTFDLYPGEPLGNGDDLRDLCQIMGSEVSGANEETVEVYCRGKRIR